MFDGEVQAAPYEMGESTGCDYCAYRDICGFDLRIDGCSYRRLEKFTVEEAVAAMWLTLEENGQQGNGAKENEQQENSAKENEQQENRMKENGLGSGGEQG